MLIQVEKLAKDYHLGKTVIPALKGLDFTIDSGDFLSIMGPSGCGKTTLLNLLGCIDKPSRGRILFQGQDLAQLNDNQEADKRLGQMGFIFQSFNLVPVLSVFENVELPLILAKVHRKERRSRVNELCAQVGLEEYLVHKPDELSGGQRQRVAIARALVNRPSLVIADEPTANLDSETGDSILNLMAQLNREQGVTFLFSTHNPDILRYAKRRILLKDGQIVHDGPVPAGQE